MSNEHFHTRYTDEIICPHCGYMYTDSWELGHTAEGTIIDHGEEECERCEKVFIWEKQITVEYSTDKKEDDSDSEDQPELFKL